MTSQPPLIPHETDPLVRRIAKAIRGAIDISAETRQVVAESQRILRESYRLRGIPAGPTQPRPMA